MKLFVKTDDKLILFNSYAGRKFDDSPRAIFEVMKADKRFTNYKMVWAFHEPDKFVVEDAIKIKTDGLKYFKTALTARVWITNSSVERGLNFVGKNTLYFNTWHGTPIKKMGSEIKHEKKSHILKKISPVDVFMSQSEYESEIFSRTYNIPKERFLKAGLPRNDILANYSAELRRQIRAKLLLPEDKKVILYCPTFREFEKDKLWGIVLAPPIDLNKWEKELGTDFVLLFRAHYEVSRAMEIRDNMFVRNMTDYPNLNELIIATDILISDYSSIFFDYSITGKPMFHFTYDYEKYASQRGMYFDIRDYLSGAESEDELIEILKSFDEKDEIRKTISFRKQFVNYYGHATNQAVDCIAKRINRVS